MRVLSTKILTPEQQQILTQANIQVEAYNAITTNPVSFETTELIENAIIASQRAAKIILDKNIAINNCFCVGGKTAAFLKENSINVVEHYNYGEQLANTIIEKHKGKAFHFFCSNIRRDELPDILFGNNIDLKEITVYNTELNTQAIEEKFDGILFFSPSGIEAYTTNNIIKTETAYCIGNTTAKAVEPYTKNIIIASSPTVEHLLETVVKHTVQI